MINFKSPPSRFLGRRCFRFVSLVEADATENCGISLGAVSLTEVATANVGISLMTAEVAVTENCELSRTSVVTEYCGLSLTLDMTEYCGL